MRPFQPGDKVAYSVQFLDSIGAGPTDELCHLRGTVEAVQTVATLELVSVRWADGNVIAARAGALAHVGPNSRFCKC